MSLRPLLFVAMPFGRKSDPSGRFEIDFDDIYGRAIKAAAEASDVDVIRADEEVLGGPIHVAMYERLLLAEIVVADLTLSNPNVFYELGVRHAARPRATILVYARHGQLPFDLSPMRAIPYDLEDGKLPDAAVAPFVDILKGRIERAKTDLEHTDSPLFQMLPGLQPPALAHEVTESFRDRIAAISDIQNRLHIAVEEGGHDRTLQRLSAIEAELRPFAGAPPAILVDLMLAYRTISAWDQLVHFVDELPAKVRSTPTVQEQLALALNRRNGPGDRRRSITILRGLIASRGPSSETYSILGRVYKDAYTEHHDAGREGEAAAALQEAVESYLAGFEADPRDYYPGINAITLSLLQGDDAARARIQELRPVVSFAVARRGGLGSNDYWDVATAYELAAIGQEWETVRRAAGRLSVLAQEAWMLETTVNNSRLIGQWLDAQGGQHQELDRAIAMLDRRAAEIAAGTAP